MIPKIIAMLQRIIPILELPFISRGRSAEEFATTLKISPTTEKGILSQFKEPKHGIKATNIPTIDKIPKIKLAICIDLMVLIE